MAKEDGWGSSGARILPDRPFASLGTIHLLSGGKLTVKPLHYWFGNQSGSSYPIRVSISIVRLTASRCIMRS